METKPDRAVSIIECDMNVSGRGRKGGWGPWAGVMQPLGFFGGTGRKMVPEHCEEAADLVIGGRVAAGSEMARSISISALRGAESSWRLRKVAQLRVVGTTAQRAGSSGKDAQQKGSVPSGSV